MVLLAVRDGEGELGTLAVADRTAVRVAGDDREAPWITKLAFDLTIERLGTKFMRSSHGCPTSVVIER